CMNVRVATLSDRAQQPHVRLLIWLRPGHAAAVQLASCVVAAANWTACAPSTKRPAVDGNVGDDAEPVSVFPWPLASAKSPSKRQTASMLEVQSGSGWPKGSTIEVVVVLLVVVVVVLDVVLEVVLVVVDVVTVVLVVVDVVVDVVLLVVDDVVDDVVVG